MDATRTQIEEHAHLLAEPGWVGMEMHAPWSDLLVTTTWYGMGERVSDGSNLVTIEGLDLTEYDEWLAASMNNEQ